MRSGLWTKGIVIGTIILFLGVSVLPSINGNSSNMIQLSRAKDGIIDQVDQQQTKGCERGILFKGSDWYVQSFPSTSDLITSPQEGQYILTNENEPLSIQIFTNKEILTNTKQPTLFDCKVICPFDDYFLYEWDFNGDGIIDLDGKSYSGKNFQSFFIFNKTGTYQALLKVSLPYGNYFNEALINVIVDDGLGVQTLNEKTHSNNITRMQIPGDGIIQKYAIMINGGAEERFWLDVDFTYKMLINDYGYNTANIYLLNSDGLIRMEKIQII